MTDIAGTVKRAVQVAEPKIDALAKRLLRDEPALGTSLKFGPLVRQGAPPTPNLIICDQSGIELFDVETIGQFELRMAILARPGDTVVVRRRDLEFENYLGDYLGIRDVSFIETGPLVAEPVARQLRTNPKLASTLENSLPVGTPLTIHAYLTNGHVWRLAKALSEGRQIGVSVAGPSPRISQRANDKLWFWSMVRALTGKGSAPPTLYAFGPSAAAAKVARFARNCEAVVVKVPSSAGGQGNLRLPSVYLEDLNLSDIRNMIEERLCAVGWRRTYPILVGVWESGITASPSVQMWLPRIEDGLPQIHGLFEQRVEGFSGKFSGAQPAALSEEITQQLLAEAATIGALLQRVGYFGPCSLDALIRDRGNGGFELHLVECNGRWSGVSIPLRVARRLRSEPSTNGLIILQDMLPEAKPASTYQLLRLLEGIVFRKGAAEEGIVILSPPDRPGGMSLNVMAVAKTQPRAAALIEDFRRKLSVGQK